MDFCSCTIDDLAVITARKRHCGKAVFLHLSVSQCVHRRRGVCPPHPLSADPPGRPPIQTPPGCRSSPVGQTPPRDTSTSGRYAVPLEVTLCAASNAFDAEIGNFVLIAKNSYNFIVVRISRQMCLLKV